MGMSFLYAGFLSYAHADEAIAAKLHRALERYKIPKGVEGKLTPIFRDTDELTAHHSLSEKIKGAVTDSKVLIVLCSPAAKASHWVNEDIRLFRAIHGEASILCVLAEGTPETSFPPALLAGGREPLAANLGGSKDSFRLGVSQIAAAMLGVGLDTLIQRETRRKRRRLQAVTAGALIFSGLMGTTTFTAVTAQKAAETNRMQAEGLVEYMITDLKEKLEPVGRLDILDSIGDRAVEYYEAQEIEKLPDDSLARQARARHILGKVALDAYQYEKAQKEIEAAARITREIYDRNPEDTDAIFNHAQSEYWVGEVYKQARNYEAAMSHWRRYAELGKSLSNKDPMNISWVMERGWGAGNLGLLYNQLGAFDEAKSKFIEAISYFENASQHADYNFQGQVELANALAGLSHASLAKKEKREAFNYRRRQAGVYMRLLKQNPQHYNLRFRYAQSLTRMITDGFLDSNGSNLNRTINTALEGFDIVIEHDPKNTAWRNEYILALDAISKHLKENELSGDNLALIQRRLKELQAL